MQFEDYLKLGEKNQKTLFKRIKKEMKKEGLVFKTLDKKINQFYQSVTKNVKITKGGSYERNSVFRMD